MNNFKKVLIIPGNDDQNRGDQALVWETKKIIERKFGKNTEIRMICNPDKSLQSIKNGIGVNEQILDHPSKRSNQKNNFKYNFLIKLSWGFNALLDFITKFPLLTFLNPFFALFLSKSKKETLSFVKECDCVFVKGGGFLHCKKSLIGLYKILYSTFHIKLALKYKKKVYIMPNSFGPIENSLARKIVINVLNKSSLVLCRESISYKYLVDCLNIKNAVLGYDLGFSLMPCEDKVVKDIYSNICKLTSKKIVGITVRPYRETEKSTFDNYVSSFVSFIHFLEQKGYFPVFYEHVYNENVNEQDLFAIRAITNHLEKGTYFIVSNKELNCESISYLYSKNSLLVGTRFHSVIFSMSSNIPSIVVTYGGNKGVGILKDIGISECGVSINEISLDALQKAFYYLDNNKERILEKVYNYRAKAVDFNNHIVEKLI